MAVEVAAVDKQPGTVAGYSAYKAVCIADSAAAGSPACTDLGFGCPAARRVATVDPNTQIACLSW